MGPAHAQEADLPRFLIEAIDVLGVSVASPQAIIAESRLVTGREYTENELHQAVFRVNRLPFVVKAEFSLRKGSQRGTHRLVIDVVEVKRFFFGFDLGVKVAGPEVIFEDYGERQGAKFQARQHQLAGIRSFIGSHAEMVAAVTQLGAGKSDDVFFFNFAGELGVTFHDALGKREALGAYLTGDRFARRTFPMGLVPSFATWTLNDAFRLSVEGTFPIARNQGLRVKAAVERSGDGSSVAVRGGSPFDWSNPGGSFRDLRDDIEYGAIDAGWFYDTTDHPLFPSRGRFAAVGIDFQSLKSEQRIEHTFPVAHEQIETEKIDQADFQSRLIRIVGQGSYVARLSKRQSLALSAKAAAGYSHGSNAALEDRVTPSFSGPSFEIGGTISHYLNLKSPSLARHRELWLTSQGEIGYERFFDDGPSIAGAALKVRLGTTLAYRASGGLFRLSLEYLSVQGGRP